MALNLAQIKELFNLFLVVESDAWKVVEIENQLRDKVVKIVR